MILNWRYSILFPTTSVTYYVNVSPELELNFLVSEYLTLFNHHRFTDPQLLYIMIQRTLLRNAGAFSCPVRSFSKPYFSSSFSPVRTVSSPLPRRTAISRFYSTPVEPNVNTDANSSAAGQTQADGNEGAEHDPLKRDLQVKEREIIDLKVRLSPQPSSFLDGLANGLLLLTWIRTDTSAQ